MPFLEHIAGQSGLVGRPREEKWLRRNESLLHLPSVKVLMKSIDQLPQVVKLPTYGGKRMEQKIEFIGLPNQCFYCKQVGHFVNECHRRKNKIRQGKWDQNQPQNRQHPLQEGDAPTEISGGQKRTEEVRKDEKVWHMVGKAKKVAPIDDEIRSKNKDIDLILSNGIDALI